MIQLLHVNLWFLILKVALVSIYYLFLGFSDTFQLIAFLLSVFNIASAMVANANNNNNNNNNNDNKFNGNENNINEGNADSAVMAMNMIMPGGRTFPGMFIALNLKFSH